MLSPLFYVSFDLYFLLCVNICAVHTLNEDDAAGTAMAIAYVVSALSPTHLLS